MFLSSCLLLIPMILAAESEHRVGNYIVKVQEGFEKTLKSIEVISDPSEELNFPDKRLVYIDDNAFKNITHLKILNLFNNSLFILRKSMFASLTNLEQLNLSFNKIYLLFKPFGGLRNLKVLDLTKNKITILQANSFLGLTKSCVIWLKGNNIHSMSTNLYENESLTVNPLERRIRVERKRIKICVNNANKLFSVEHFTEGEKLASGCSTREYNSDGILNLSKMHIAGFQKGWYKLEDLPIDHINLNRNRITRLTSEMFNDLPENIKSVDLVQNQFVRLEKGFIMNEHLRKMNFRINYINEIEDDVFINTNLAILNLSVNKLTDMKFAATLPSTLTTISLEENKIAGISREFFKGLPRLRILDLGSNYISELKSDVFDDLKNIEEIFLGSNGIWNFTINLPDNLKVLDLQYNLLKNLKAGTFVKSPTYKLLLNNNLISNIENGSFNLPDLIELDLRHNYFSVIDSGKLEGLKNLRNLWLESNSVATVEEGSFQNLTRLCKLAFSPINRLESGTLLRLVQTEGCDFVVADMPIEMIQGSVFTINFHTPFYWK